eukprot:CAMPEP_0179085822 /NCGR_PEP_ID=MMETSP0796-20121207/38890_1 /TAXON_ID=73915 /ORGANISM="Pyrodinium bahamense, Strain pbaha01" /LENGTH=196 /DNA_ID=CAMNT_0020783269 /DNA_START=57 /DNA_END=647 /DNA_ORIENTATION=-
MGDVAIVVGGKKYKGPGNAVILMVASPVFRKMLDSGMKEAKEQKIQLPGKSMEEFHVFMSFLVPGSSRCAKFTINNIDFLLQWFHEYEILDLTDECESFLMLQPCSLERLLQAKRFGLSEQYKRCVAHFASNPEQMDMNRIRECDADVLFDLLSGAKSQAEQLKSKAEQLKHAVRCLPNQLYGELLSAGITERILP